MKKLYPIALFSLLATSPFIAHADVVWEEIESATQENLHHIDFTGGNGWIVGNAGMLLTTHNEGENWKNSTKQGLSWSFVDFINPNKGWAIDGKQISTTVDSGKTWSTTTDVRFEGANNLIQFIDENRGWVYSAGRHFLTTDGGLTWQEKDGEFYSLASGSDIQVTQDDIWTASWIGGIITSRDAGANWTTQKPDGVYYQTGISFINQNRGWVAGYKYDKLSASSLGCKNDYHGYIFTTTDGGDTWEKTTNLCGFTQKINFINEKQGWLIIGNNSNSRILSTLDGGYTWKEEFKAPKSGYLNDLYIIDENNGWAVGDNGLLLQMSSNENSDGSTAAGIAQCQADPTSCNISTLINISTRAYISGGENDAFAGFVIAGNTPKKVMIRGISVDSNVDPKILVLDHLTKTEMGRNDNWETNVNAAKIKQLPIHLQLPNTRDAGLLIDLNPGTYDVVLSSTVFSGLAIVSIDEVSSSQ